MARHIKHSSTADMYRVSHLRWREGLNQSQIVAVTGMTKNNVRRALEQAIDQGIVKIQIQETPERYLEQQIVDKFSLKRVFVVPGKKVETLEECDKLFEAFGKLGAEFFQEVWEKHPRDKKLHVGVAGGARLLEFANAVSVRKRENVHVHVTALVGRGPLTEVTSHIEPTVAASILWTHCGSLPGHCEYETVEPYRFDGLTVEQARNEVNDEIARLEQHRSIQDVIEHMDHLDIVFAGFGFADAAEADQEFRNRITMRSLVESVLTPDHVTKERCAGDYCYCPYRANGSQDKNWRFFLTAGHYAAEHNGIEFYKKMVLEGKTVVGFGGPHLLPAIKGALKGKIVNVLIIDEFTARQLVNGDVPAARS